MLENAIIEELLSVERDVKKFKRMSFTGLAEEFLKFVRKTPEYQQLLKDVKNADKLNDELRKRKEIIHQERLKRAALEMRLSAAYAESKASKDANIRLRQTVAELEAAPVRSQKKVENLKTLISEMRLEIKRLQPKEERLDASIELEESEVGAAIPSKMFDKRVSIFGGYRANNIVQLPNVKTMTGYENPDDFEPLIKNSDLVIVLTQYIGHVSMWSIKAFCAMHNKPVLFTKHTNISVILHEAERMV